jgi:hypothetical protein
MHGSKTDQKNIQLLKMLAQLREHIDIHRIIGLNGDALRKAGINGALLGYLQKSAHESLAMYICKIFEASTRNDLNSIPGLIESIPKAPLSDMQAEELGVFGKKYGHAETPTEAKVYLRDVFELFRVAHSESLGRLKEFRDTIGAHSDYRADITFLPSHPEFESLISFAKDFYEVISRTIIESGPAVIPRVVGRNFLSLLATVGVKDAKFDFED